ncbi:MAG: glycosyltransferase family 2 protein [Thermoprotei archaeon]|nr:glycosyltransferase family 2 protein [Thermoprotei archaeon]
MKVDVVLLTKNSNKPVLRLVLESLYKNVNVNRLIVVDGGSTDGTVELLSKYPRVEIHYDANGTRATSREIGIKCVETEWFLFLDSDVVLCKNWQRIAEKYIRDDVGAVQGRDVPVRSPEIQDYFYAISRLKELIKVKSGLGMDANARGFTGDVLIRTELVKDIKIPKFLHIYEDYYIKRYIERKGFKWVIPKDLYCYHLMGDRSHRIKSDAYMAGYFCSMLNLYKLSSVIGGAMGIFPKVLVALCMRPNFKMAKFQILRQTYFFVGFLRGYMRGIKI